MKKLLPFVVATIILPLSASAINMNDIRKKNRQRFQQQQLQQQRNFTTTVETESVFNIPKGYRLVKVEQETEVVTNSPSVPAGEVHVTSESEVEIQNSGNTNDVPDVEVVDGAPVDNGPVDMPEELPQEETNQDDSYQDDINPDFYAGINSCTFVYEVRHYGAVFIGAAAGKAAITCRNGQHWDLDIAGLETFLTAGYVKEVGEVVLSIDTGKSLRLKDLLGIIVGLQGGIAAGETGFVGGAHIMLTTGINAGVGVTVAKATGLGVLFGKKYWGMWDVNDINNPIRRDLRRRAKCKNKTGIAQQLCRQRVR